MSLLVLAGILAGPQPVQVTNVPTSAGFTSADWLAIISIVVLFFGLALTALGTLSMFIISGMRGQLTELSDGLDEFKDSVAEDRTRVWEAIGALRGSSPIIGGRRRHDPPPP